MRWLLFGARGHRAHLLMLTVVFFAAGMSGCAKQKRDSGAENMESSSEADTAALDAADAPAEGTSAPAQPETEVPAAGEEPGVAQEPTASQEASVSQESGVAETASAPTADSPPAMSSAEETASYVVQKDDTLMKISFNVYGDISQWKQIYELNKDLIKNANRLAAGMRVKYYKPATEPVVERNGDPYMIKPGDTLGTIADDVYAKRSKWRKLWENNRTLIQDPNKIYAGFYLYYQITETEKQEAEAIKAKRGGAQPLGQSAAPAVSEPAVSNRDPASLPAK